MYVVLWYEIISTVAVGAAVAVMFTNVYKHFCRLCVYNSTERTYINAELFTYTVNKRHMTNRNSVDRVLVYIYTVPQTMHILTLSLFYIT